MSEVKIISEQHDLGMINWVAGLSDPGEMIKCGYLPQIRRLAGEDDVVYAERIRPIVMALPKDERDMIMGAAVKRASLDTSNGRINVMVAGKPAWHGLGVHIAEACDSINAMKLGGLDWLVSKEQLAYAGPDGKMRTQDKAYAIVRNDTGACLGVVGSQYQVIQNHEAFDFMDTVLKEFGAKYETAGSIYGGEKTWMLVQLPQQSFTLPGDDENLAYSIFTNPHDGSGMAYCYPTNVRTVCANTYRRAESMKDRGIGLRHTGDLKARIAEARRALGLTVKGFAKFAEVAGVMVRTPLPDVKVYVNEVLDEVLDITAAKIAEGADAIAARIHGAVANTPEAQTARDKLVKHLERQIARRREIVDDILTIYEGPTCKIGDMSGTAWAGWNSVTGWIAHGKTKQRQVGTMEARLSRKFESIICGDGDNVNQIAFQKALEYLPA